MPNPIPSRERHSIDGAVGAGCVALNDFDDAGVAETFEHLRSIVLIPTLGQRQGIAKKSPDPHGRRWTDAEPTRIVFKNKVGRNAPLPRPAYGCRPYTAK